jgi:hypothetical protein
MTIAVREAGLEATGEGIDGWRMADGPSSYLSRSSLDRILRGAHGSFESFLICSAPENRMPLFRPRESCNPRTHTFCQTIGWP